jgi:hypothetical protein
MSTLINSLCIEPFSKGDRVKVTHPSFRDCITTTGNVTGCKKDLVPDYDGPKLWMVSVTLDNGRRVGVRPHYVEYISSK